MAIGASFSIYLIPLIGSHGAWLLGEKLLKSGTRMSVHWLETNIAVALVAQLLAAALLYWFFLGRGWRRGAVLPPVAIAVAMALNWAYLIAIPTMFLEEPDTAAEHVSWSMECSAPAAFQTNLRTGTELWVRFSAVSSDYGVLTMPGCKVTAVSLPKPAFTSPATLEFLMDPISASAGGRAIAQMSQPREGRLSWWLTPGAPPKPNAALLPIEPPPAHSGSGGAPVLSTDGQWAAWLEAIPNTGPPVLDRVFLRALDSREHERIVDLSGLGPASYSVQKLDMKSGELLLWKTDRLVSVGLDGRLRKEFGRPGAAHPQSGTYIEMGENWLAWDAYREDGNYIVEWWLPSGSGSHRVPLGRSIHSSSVDSRGKWIAVSVGTGLNIGSARDAVYVLSAADGHEVFRKYLPRFTRTPVAFLDGGF